MKSIQFLSNHRIFDKFNPPLLSCACIKTSNYRETFLISIKKWAVRMNIKDPQSNHVRLCHFLSAPFS
jgi:hypothetical protein